jgi:hypothetical protein
MSAGDAPAPEAPSFGQRVGIYFGVTEPPDAAVHRSLSWFRLILATEILVAGTIVLLCVTVPWGIWLIGFTAFKVVFSLVHRHWSTRGVHRYR